MGYSIKKSPGSCGNYQDNMSDLYTMMISYITGSERHLTFLRLMNQIF
jgi:hypothetical protein